MLTVSATSCSTSGYGFRPVIEEGALAVHDRARDLEQRLVSGIQV
jgi:hypothetical protein